MSAGFVRYQPCVVFLATTIWDNNPTVNTWGVPPQQEHY